MDSLSDMKTWQVLSAPSLTESRGRWGFEMRMDSRKPVRFGLILSRESFMHPQEFLAFVHHADETAEAGVFGFDVILSDLMPMCSCAKIIKVNLF